jgi:hypothetical protein
MIKIVPRVERLLQMPSERIMVTPLVELSRIASDRQLRLTTYRAKGQVLLTVEPLHA